MFLDRVDTTAAPPWSTVELVVIYHPSTTGFRCDSVANADLFPMHDARTAQRDLDRPVTDNAVHTRRSNGRSEH